MSNLLYIIIIILTKAIGNMKTLKYNHNYLEYVAETFTKKVLDSFQKDYIDKGFVELTQEEKEFFVSCVIENQFKLPDRLRKQQEELGDTFIDFFMNRDVLSLFVSCYLGTLLGRRDLVDMTNNFISIAWAAWTSTEEGIKEKGKEKNENRL